MTRFWCLRSIEHSIHGAEIKPAKIVPCKSCGTQVALGAIVCPNCGELNPGIRYGGVLPELFGVIAVLTVALWPSLRSSAPICPVEF